MVAVPFPAGAVSGEGTLRLTFTATGGAGLAWMGSAQLTDGTAPDALRAEGAGQTVTIVGSAADLGSYLAAGGLKVGASASASA
jgi:hypothetical protein